MKGVLMGPLLKVTVKVATEGGSLLRDLFKGTAHGLPLTGCYLTGHLVRLLGNSHS